jgi:hypothetical protein
MATSPSNVARAKIFVDAIYCEDIKRTYVSRNLARIETEAEKQIEVEIEQAKNGYWRMKPFLEKIAATIAEDGS